MLTDAKVPEAILRVPGAAALGDGESVAFRFRVGEFVREGFILRVRGEVRAWLNSCPHWGVDLDLGDGRFWAPDLGYIYCKNHGALFRAEDGVCVAGPCAGLALTGFPHRLDGDDVLVAIRGAAPLEQASEP